MSAERRSQRTAGTAGTTRGRIDGSRHGRRILAIAAACGAVLGVAGCTAGAAPHPVVHTVLLTDDDGWSAPGISAMRSALVDAGYEVTIVAPATDQSGVSMSSVPGPLTLARANPSRSIWSVSGTPVDAVRVALSSVLTSPPDIVVSGVNHGANAGLGINYSGTVGAALEAAGHRLPAIAVSADVGAEPDSFAAPAAAALVVRVLADLDASALDELRGRVLNVNAAQHTTTTSGTERVRFAPQADVPWADLDYVAAPDGTVVPQSGLSTGAPHDSDVAWVRAGWTTLTVLENTRDDGAPQYGAIHSALEALTTG